MKAKGASSLSDQGKDQQREVRRRSRPPTAERGRADLHIHTSFSDGWPGPVDAVRRARQLGLAVIAITDHDTIEGALWAADFAHGSGQAPHVIVSPLMSG